MKAIIAGSTGMIGSMVLGICLESGKIQEVRSLVRRHTGIEHDKLIEILVQDFGDYSEHYDIFKNIDNAFFCIGAYSGQVSDEQLKKITVDYAVQFASALKLMSPRAAICLLSGAGADRTEKSRSSFARYKGMAENRISAMNMNLYSFRPAYKYPVAPRREPNMMYQVLRHAYPILKVLGSNFQYEVK